MMLTIFYELLSIYKILMHSFNIHKRSNTNKVLTRLCEFSFERFVVGCIFPQRRGEQPRMVNKIIGKK